MTEWQIIILYYDDVQKIKKSNIGQTEKIDGQGMTFVDTQGGKPDR